MRIIFLDVDGVLNSNAFFDSQERDGKEISETYLERLSQIYHAFPDTKIVLSSSWKNLSDNHYLRIFLYEKIKEYDMEIIDQTPHIRTNFDYNKELKRNDIKITDIDCERPMEIKLWLDTHPGITKWVSIEDDWNKENYELISKDFASHLVKTEFYCDDFEDGGIKINDITLAINILK